MSEIIFLLLDYSSEDNKLIYSASAMNLSFIKDYVNIQKGSMR